MVAFEEKLPESLEKIEAVHVKIEEHGAEIAKHGERVQKVENNNDESCSTVRKMQIEWSQALEDINKVNIKYSAENVST